jgi:hypothetical protein
VNDNLPDWADRELLAEAVQANGLPWVPGAVWRRPDERWLALGDRLLAIALAARVVATARRLLPPGVAVDRDFRDAAWRCTVAGLALLGADARLRLADVHGHRRGVQ